MSEAASIVVLDQAAADTIIDQRYDADAAVGRDLVDGRPGRPWQWGCSALCEASALCSDPGRADDHGRQVALLDAQVGDGVEFLLGGASGAGGSPGRVSCGVDASVLGAERAVRANSSPMLRVCMSAIRCT